MGELNARRGRVHPSIVLVLSLQAVAALAQSATDAAPSAPAVDDASEAPPSSATELAPVTVYGARVGDVAVDAASATKTDTPIIETPQSISVVACDQMDDRGVQNLTDTLHYAAGVRTDAASGAGVTQDNFYIRGFSRCRGICACSSCRDRCASATTAACR